MRYPSLRLLLVLLVVLAGRGFSANTSQFVDCVKDATVVVEQSDNVDGCKSKVTAGWNWIYYGMISSNSTTGVYVLSLYGATLGGSQDGQMTIKKKPPCNVTLEQCRQSTCSWPYDVKVNTDQCLCQIDFSKYMAQDMLAAGCLAYCNTAYNYSRSDCPSCSPIPTVNQSTNLDILKGQLSCKCNLANGTTFNKPSASCDYDKTCKNDPSKCNQNTTPTPTGKTEDGNELPKTSTTNTTTTNNPDGSTTQTTTTQNSNGSTSTTTKTTTTSGNVTETTTTTPAPDGSGNPSGTPNSSGNSSNGTGPDYTGVLNSIDNGVQMTVSELRKISEKMGSDSGNGMSDSAIVDRLNKILKKTDSAYFGQYETSGDSGKIQDSNLVNDDEFLDELKDLKPDSVGSPNQGILNVWEPVKNQIMADFPESEGCQPQFQWTLNFGPIGTHVIDVSAALPWIEKAIRLLDYGSALAAFFLFFFGLNRVFSDLRSNQ